MTSYPPQPITVTARQVLNREYDLSVYPCRHLTVMQVAKIGPPDSQIPLVMSAIEMLSQEGWELAGFTMAGSAVVAVLRRL